MYDLQPRQPQYLGTPYNTGPTPNQEPPRDEVDFRSIMSMIKARRKLIALIMIGCIGIAVLLSFVMHKKWMASGQLVLTQKDPRLVTAAQIASYEVPDTESIETQLGLIESPAMAQRIIDRLKSDAVSRGQTSSSIVYTPDDIARLVVVTNPKDTAILNVNAIGTSPDEALALADATCSAFVDLKKEMAQHDVASEVEALQGKVAQLHSQASVSSSNLNAFKQAHHVTDEQLEQRALLDQIPPEHVAAEIVNVLAAVQSLVRRFAHASGFVRDAGQRNGRRTRIAGCTRPERRRRFPVRGQRGEQHDHVVRG